MEDTKILLGRVNLCLRKNLGKATIALLVVFLCSATLAPLAVVLAGNFLPLALVLVFLMPVVLFMLQLSFAMMCAKMYREEPCVLGNLLDSFRDWRRYGSLALGYAVSAVIVCSVLVVGGTLLSYFISGANPATFDDEAALGLMLTMFPVTAMLAMVVFFLLVLLPTSCIHLVLMDNPSMPVLSALQENFRLLKGRKLELLKFLLRTGSFWLVGAVVCLGLSFGLMLQMMGQTDATEGTVRLLLGIGKLLDMLYFIFVYTTLIRLVIGVAAFYQSLQEPSAQDADAVSPLLSDGSDASSGTGSGSTATD